MVDARGKVSYEHTDPDTGKKSTIYHEPRPKPVHCKAEGGRCPFGGWQKDGIAIYKKKRAELQKLYEAGHRNTDFKRIKKEDEACLSRLRIKYDRDSVEQKRRARNKGKGTPAEEDEDDDGDDFDV